MAMEDSIANMTIDQIKTFVIENPSTALSYQAAIQKRLEVCADYIDMILALLSTLRKYEDTRE